MRGRRLGFDSCLNTRGYGRLAGGLGIKSRRDLRFDGGFYINLRAVAARHGQEDDRGKRGQEGYAKSCAQCWGVKKTMMTVGSYRDPDS